MPKVCDDTVLDGGLNTVKTTCTRMCVISGAGLAINATVANINSVRLAEQTGMGTGDFTIAAGSQRQLTVAAKGPLTPSASGTPTHITLDNGTKLIYQTTCTGSALTSGGAGVNIPTWTITFAGPT
jgi:hypothetical protein